MGRLEDYVRDARLRGFSDSQVRAGLVRAGYSKEVVDSVLRPFFQVSRRRGLVWFAVGLSLFILLVILVYLFVPVSVLFEVVPPVQRDVVPGSVLLVERIIEADGDVRIIYSFVGSGGNLAGQKVEVLRVVGRNVGKVRLPVPVEGGLYTVSAELLAEGFSVKKSFEISVLEQPVKSVQNVTFVPEAESVLECPRGCDDLNSCTRDVCVEGACRHDVIVPCCGDGVCDAGESGLSCVQDCAAKVELAEDVAAKARSAGDVSLAVSLCQSIPQGVKADACLYEAARSSGVAQVCSSIGEVRSRDACLMEFALKNDFSVCPQVSHEFLQRNCYALERLRGQTELG